MKLKTSKFKDSNESKLIHISDKKAVPRELWNSIIPRCQLILCHFCVISFKPRLCFLSLKLKRNAVVALTLIGQNFPWERKFPIFVDF